MMTALATRVLFFLFIAHPEAQAGRFELRGDTDEADYHRLAFHLADSGQLKMSPDGPPTALRPPGTILPLAALYRLAGPLPFLGVVYVGLCSLAIVWIVGALARETTGDLVTTRLAMLLAAVTPTLVYIGTGIWSDTPTLLFTLLSLLLIFKARELQPQLLLFGVAGLSLGIACIHRPSAAFVALLVAAGLLIDGWKRRGMARAALFAALAAIPIVGWGLWNLQALGGFYTGNTQSTVTLWQSNNPVTAGLRPPAMRTAKGYDLYREAEEGRYRGSWIPLKYISEGDPWRDGTLPELEAEAWLRDQAIGFALEHPGPFLKLLAYKALRIVTAEPTAPSVLAESATRRRFKRIMTFAERWFFIALGSWGMLLMWRRRPTHAGFYLLHCVAGLAVAFIAYPNARILLPVTATLIVPAAMALAGIWQRIPTLKRAGQL